MITHEVFVEQSPIETLNTEVAPNRVGENFFNFKITRRRSILGYFGVGVGSTIATLLPAGSLIISNTLYNAPITASLEARSFASLGICLVGLAASGLIVRSSSQLIDSTGNQSDLTKQ